MYGNTELSFKVNLPIDEDELSVIRGFINYLQSIICEKEKSIEQEKEIELVRKSSKRKSIAKFKEPEPVIKEVGESDSYEEEEVKEEPKVEDLPKCYTTKPDGSVECQCGSSMEAKNINRHFKTGKHLKWIQDKK
jgi:serine phosphatase RsbU (regulator of sigma subunit)